MERSVEAKQFGPQIASYIMWEYIGRNARKLGISFNDWRRMAHQSKRPNPLDTISVTIYAKGVRTYSGTWNTYAPCYEAMI